MQYHKEHYHIGESPSGLDITIHKHLFTSQKNGRTIYIQGGIHGGEITFWLFNKLFKYLEQDAFKGKIILVPIANPIAWNQRIYFYNPGKFSFYNGKDWNRNFPGNKLGNLGERISSTISKFVLDADLVIDLHTSRKSIPFTITLSEKNLEITQRLKIKYNYLADTEEKSNASLGKTLSGFCLEKGIPNIAIECGSHDSYNPKHVETVFKALKNLLRHKTKNEIERNTPLKYFKKLKTYRAPCGGFVKYNFNPGEIFKKGEELFRIYETKTLNTYKKIKAKENGVILKSSPTHILWSGDEVLQVINEEDLNNI
jgi:predicted deacylase